MPRPIDADALISKICGYYCGCERTECGMEEINEPCKRVSFIEDAPTLSPDDLRPVGKWIEDAMRIKCSVCGTDFSDEVTCCSDCYRWPWNYCPNCGAKIEEVN